MQKHYLENRAAFDSLSREWSPGHPTPVEYPCLAVWIWVDGFSGKFVEVQYVYLFDFEE